MHARTRARVRDAHTTHAVTTRACVRRFRRKAACFACASATPPRSDRALGLTCCTVTCRVAPRHTAAATRRTVRFFDAAATRRTVRFYDAAATRRTVRFHVVCLRRTRRSDRDFDSNDYDTLLALDANNVVPKAYGASEGQIRRLPE